MRRFLGTIWGQLLIVEFLIGLVGHAAGSIYFLHFSSICIFLTLAVYVAFRLNLTQKFDAWFEKIKLPKLHFHKWIEIERELVDTCTVLKNVQVGKAGKTVMKSRNSFFTMFFEGGKLGERVITKRYGKRYEWFLATEDTEMVTYRCSKCGETKVANLKSYTYHRKATAAEKLNLGVS